MSLQSWCFVSTYHLVRILSWKNVSHILPAFCCSAGASWFRFKKLGFLTFFLSLFEIYRGRFLLAWQILLLHFAIYLFLLVKRRTVNVYRVLLLLRYVRICFIRHFLFLVFTIFFGCWHFTHSWSGLFLY